MDMIDRYIILLCLLLIIGCDNSDKNNVLEVRKYKIGGIDNRKKTQFGLILFMRDHCQNKVN
jgi:hypothetical protein